MRSLKRRFKKVIEKNINASSYVSFARAITGQKFSRNMIARWFKKLVEKDDYEKLEKNQLIKNLVNLSNTPVDNKFQR